MTTLAEGKADALRNLAPEKDKDPVYYQKMVDQLFAITTGANPYFAWLDLPPKEKNLYESMEDHPEGYELCGMRWVSEAMTVWGNQWQPHDELAHAQAA